MRATESARSKITRNFYRLFNESGYSNENMPDKIEVIEFDVVIALVRAGSKFIAAYGQGSPEIEAFIDWCRLEGYFAPKRVS